MRFAAAVAALLFLGAASPDDLLIAGPKGERHIASADLAALPRVTVRVLDHGKRATFEGVELYRLLERVGAPAGEQLRGKELARFVVIEARDGYRAVFSLAELSPSFTDRKVILAARRDGKPLGATDGPWQIAVAEKRMGRCVRQVRAIRIVDVP